MRNPVSRFAYAQSDIGIARTKFPRSHDHKTTLSAGLLYPLFIDEVVPGDTYSVDMSSLIRMSTPIHPVMDNCYLDTYWFFVPNRLTWEHWKEFMGESPVDPYLNPIEYSIPMLIASNADEVVPPKSVADYMGIPSNTIPSEFSALPFRGFSLIWNEWFRDQNLQNSIDVDLGDRNANYVTYGAFDQSGDSYVFQTAYGGALPPVNKYHDYFTSALKEPQKGDPVPIPLSGFAPVYASDLVDVTNVDGFSDSSIQFFNGNEEPIEDKGLGTGEGGSLRVNTTQDIPTYQDPGFVYPRNMGADLNNIMGSYATISDLRYAFQLQKYLENDSRSGSRYREVLKAHYNVTSPDASLQIPQFLGGKRIPINISQVLQTSSTDDTSPQGNTAAYSLTSDKYSAFTASFTEHGYLFCVGCIRTDHTYAQGLERMWSRKNKFDFYFPEFANISEQPIYNREIFLSTEGSSSATEGEVFGFKEAWAEYRFKPNRISGEFRPTYAQSLDIWHYGDDYLDQPYLSDEWIRETRANIDRTLAVQSDTSDQFICDFYFKLDTVRCMPPYSIPGLADHH